MTVASDCSAAIPVGPGYGALEMVTDSVVVQNCVEGFIDNNNGAGQGYTCPAGKFYGTILNCTGTNPFLAAVFGFEF